MNITTRARARTHVPTYSQYRQHLERQDHAADEIARYLCHMRIKTNLNCITPNQFVAFASTINLFVLFQRTHTHTHARATQHTNKSLNKTTNRSYTHAHIITTFALTTRTHLIVCARYLLCPALAQQSNTRQTSAKTQTSILTSLTD
jgi:hypothetical protein